MPMYDISVDMPNRPDGDPIEVFPFGVVNNREGSLSVEISAEEAKLLDGNGISVAKGKKGGAEQ